MTLFFIYSPTFCIKICSIFLITIAYSHASFIFLFQGHVGTTATKKIDVYLSMQSTQEKIHPMTVVTMANARVHDLIGLICWQYTCEGREPKLMLVEKTLHMHYYLFIFQCFNVNIVFKEYITQFLSITC